MSEGQGPSVPVITVQLVHIEGPLKGRIQEFTDPVITIGRSPDCSVTFPRELKVISRNHAEIRREGNRFRLIDHSTNGTFVQGRRVEDVYLKDGDVITFTEGGPKVSFLSVVQADAGVPPGAVKEATPPGSGKDRADAGVAPAVVITIQWGTALKEFRLPSVRIGSDPSCELSTDLPGIAPYHLEIRREGEGLWVKDLTGEGRTFLNGMPLTRPVAVRAGDSLRLTPDGPLLEYVGQERFVRREVTRQEEVPPPGSAPSHGQEAPAAGSHGPARPPLGSPRSMGPGVPVWVWVAAGSALLVALIVYLVVQWAG